MPMKRPGGAKREDGNCDWFQAESFPSNAAFCTGDLRCVRFLEPPPTHRPCEVHRVVALPLLVNWRGNRLGHVSLLTVKARHFDVDLTEFFCGCYCVPLEQVPLAHCQRSRFIIPIAGTGAATGTQCSAWRPKIGTRSGTSGTSSVKKSAKKSGINFRISSSHTIC